MKREECLTKATTIIKGQREDIYGTPENSFFRIAELWTTYLFNRDEGLDEGIKAKDVAIMMMLMKIARLMNDPTHTDSWVDIAGYSACGCEIETSKEEV